MSNFQEFPKSLQPADGSDDEPVIVNSPGEEAGYLARGYRLIGASDRKSFENQMLGALPETYLPVEYPKWCSGVLVNSHAEEDQLRRSLAAATAVADGAATVEDTASVSEARPRKRA
jgi:hypothetical protein